MVRHDHGLCGKGRNDPETRQGRAKGEFRSGQRRCGQVLRYPHHSCKLILKVRMRQPLCMKTAAVPTRGTRNMMRINVYTACAWLAVLALAQPAMAGQDMQQHDEQGNRQAAMRGGNTPIDMLGLDDAVALALSDNLGLGSLQARARALADVPS